MLSFFKLSPLLILAIAFPARVAGDLVITAIAQEFFSSVGTLMELTACTTVFDVSNYAILSQVSVGGAAVTASLPSSLGTVAAGQQVYFYSAASFDGTFAANFFGISALSHTTSYTQNTFKGPVFTLKYQGSVVDVYDASAAPLFYGFIGGWASRKPGTLASPTFKATDWNNHTAAFSGISPYSSKAVNGHPPLLLGQSFNCPITPAPVNPPPTPAPSPPPTTKPTLAHRLRVYPTSSAPTASPKPQPTFAPFEKPHNPRRAPRARGG